MVNSPISIIGQNLVKYDSLVIVIQESDILSHQSLKGNTTCWHEILLLFVLLHIFTHLRHIWISKQKQNWAWHFSQNLVLFVPNFAAGLCLKGRNSKTLAIEQTGVLVDRFLNSRLTVFSRSLFSWFRSSWMAMLRASVVCLQSSACLLMASFRASVRLLQSVVACIICSWMDALRACTMFLHDPPCCSIVVLSDCTMLSKWSMASVLSLMDWAWLSTCERLSSNLISFMLQLFSA